MKSLLIALFSITALLGADQKVKLTKAEHQAEAKRHATLADELANAERLAKQGSNAMQHKWPGLAQGPQRLERERAMQARRGEAEAREKVAFHHELANKTADAEP
jgi:hypothetical protein